MSTQHFDDDELETEAISKCLRALKPLQNPARVRVIKYLLDKFEIVESSTPNIDYSNSYSHTSKQAPLLPVNEERPTGTVDSSNLNNESEPEISYPTIRDAVLRELTKSESELVLAICFYESNYGTDTFDKSVITDSYKASSLYTESRRKNLNTNITRLIKSRFIKHVANESYMVTPEGKERAIMILNGNSETKVRKIVKRKSKPKARTQIES